MTKHFSVYIILENVKPHQSEDTEIITLIFSIIKRSSDCKWQIRTGSIKMAVDVTLANSESVLFHDMVPNNNHQIYAEIKYKWSGYDEIS